MDHVARDLNKPVEALRELNMYHEGDHTHFGQLLNNSQVSGRCIHCTTKGLTHVVS